MSTDDYWKDLGRAAAALHEARPAIASALDTYRQLGLGAGALEAIAGVDEHRRLLAGVADDYKVSELASRFGAATDLRYQLGGAASAIEAARLRDLYGSAWDIEQAATEALTAKAAHDSMFRLPELGEINRFAEEAKLADQAIHGVFGRIVETDAIREAMSAMRSPWLSIDHEATSAQGFADILSIGRGIAELPSFDQSLGDRLRLSLGDWRDYTAPTTDLFANTQFRLGIYRQQGVSSTLTDFPSAAFDETMEIAGLRIERQDQGRGVENEDDEERAVRVYTEMRRFERCLKQFLAQKLEESFGAKWTKQLPANMLDHWIEKREAAVNQGQPEHELIHYADFGDYIPIISRHWSNIFAAVFRRAEDVRESFHRLYPLRNATMHSRVVLLDDEILVSSETKRIRRAIQQ